MVSCTDCVHYHACKTWNNHLNDVLDIVSKTFGDITRMPFPMVDETPKGLCPTYQKAKENVQP